MTRYRLITFLLVLAYLPLSSQIFFDYTVRREFRKQLKNAYWFPETKLDSLIVGDTVQFYSFNGEISEMEFQYVDTFSSQIIPIRKLEDFIRFSKKHKIQSFTRERINKKDKRIPSNIGKYLWKDVGKWDVTSKEMGDLKIILPDKTITLMWLRRYSIIDFVVKNIELKN